MLQVAAVRSGVRAMPPRTQDGKLPLAGRVPERWLGALSQPATSLPASAPESEASGPAATAGKSGSTQDSCGAGAATDMSHGDRQAAGFGAEGADSKLMPCGPDPSPGAGDRPRRWWVLAGLGARGLTYHAWLGKHTAAAVLADDESLLPRELRAWQKRLDVQAGHASVLEC